MLFVICWSGTFAVFSYEIDWFLNPAVQGNVTYEKIDWQRAFDTFKDNFPNSELNRISAPIENGYAIDGWAENKKGKIFRFYIDPLTYVLNGETSYFNVQRFFRSFHMVLFMQDYLDVFGVPLGYWIVTLWGFVLFVSIITGFLFYKKWSKGFFKLELKKGMRRIWSDVHKLLGLWSIVFALIISFTGIWYLMEFFLEHPTYKETRYPLVEDNIEYLPISELVEKARSSYPELKIQYIDFFDFDKGIIGFAGDDGSMMVRRRAAYVKLDAMAGTVLKLQKPRQLSFYARWWETVDHVHFGKFGGVWSKMLWFLFGVALSTLCLSGAYLQAKRQRLKNGVKHHRLSVVFSYLVTIGVLVSATLAGMHEIKEYGTNGSWPDVPQSVTVFIGLWVLSTLTALTVWMRIVR